MIAKLSLWSPLTFLELVGRAVSDFGFGSLVGKYEEYFGRKVVKVMLMVVGLGVVAAGIGATWEWLISPLLTFFSTPLWGRTLASLVWTAAGIGGGVAVGLMFVTILNEWRKGRKTTRLLKEAREVLEDSRAQRDRHRAELDEILAEADDMFSKAVLVAKEAARLKVKTAKVMGMALDNARDITVRNEGLSDDERAKALDQLELLQVELTDLSKDEGDLPA